MHAQQSWLSWGLVAAGCRRKTCVVLALVAAGCRRETCAPDIRSDDAVMAERVAEAADLFLRQLSPEYTVCVPHIRIGDELDADTADDPDTYLGWYDHSSRRVVLKEYGIQIVGSASVHHEYLHALDHQNDLALGDRWGFFLKTEAEAQHAATSAIDLVGEGFALSGQTLPVFGPLLRDSCEGDDETTRRRRRALDYFVFDDVEPGWDYPGVKVEPAPFVERLRVKGGLYLIDGGDVLGVVVDEHTIPWTSFAAEPSFDGFGLLMVTTPLADVTGDGVKLLDEEWAKPARRRVFEEDNTLRLLGDGCAREGERTFTWSGRHWSVWTEGDEMVVGFWAVP